MDVAAEADGTDDLTAFDDAIRHIRILSAIAIEHGATWITLDRDFARFPGLRWEVPRLAG
ncbi:hypothetical protein [Agromyces sp. H66]|uniref:hypothetical protein n=1 Tax=Agromyces sp. H66 TaxID=2529859 RepID=UPI00145BE71C|nr:hypothetical protein [Agromyces sp. H66]